MRNPLDHMARIGKNRIHAILEHNPRLERLFDLVIICRRFQQSHGKYPDLKNPKTFSEKIICKILYDRRSVLTLIADKVRVRDYVKERIGADHLSKIYQIAEQAEDIRWNQLPSCFVLKTNHGSGWNIIVPDAKQFDKAAAVAQLNFWLSKNYYRYSREWAYRHIRPSVFVEEMLDDGNGNIPIDWKFHVFAGKSPCFHVDLDRFTDHRQNFYDRNLKRLNIRYLHDNHLNDPVFPPNMEEMFQIAERLGQGLDYIRVDLYNINGRIIFGELTNYPNTGYVRFDPEEVDRQFGDYWSLPKDHRKAA